MLLVENDQLHKIASEGMGLKQVGLGDLNDILVQCLLQVFLPAHKLDFPRTDTPDGHLRRPYRPMADILRVVCPHPDARLLMLRFLPHIHPKMLPFSEWRWPTLTRQLLHMSLKATTGEAAGETAEARQFGSMLFLRGGPPTALADMLHRVGHTALYGIAFPWPQVRTRRPSTMTAPPPPPRQRSPSPVPSSPPDSDAEEPAIPDTAHADESLERVTVQLGGSRITVLKPRQAPPPKPDPPPPARNALQRVVGGPMHVVGFADARLYPVWAPEPVALVVDDHAVPHMNLSALVLMYVHEKWTKRVVLTAPGTARRWCRCWRARSGEPPTCLCMARTSTITRGTASQPRTSKTPLYTWKKVVLPIWLVT